MNNKKTFSINLSWTFTSGVIYAFSQWLIIIILAKLGSPEIVGQFSLGLAITAPIILFFNMQMRNLIATDNSSNYEFSDYFGVNILLLLMGLILIIVFVYVSSYTLMVSIVIILVGLSKVIESLSELSHGFFQKVERMDYAGKSLLLKALSSVLAFSLIFYITRNLNLSLIGLIITWMLRLLLYDLKKVKKFVKIKPRINKFKEIVLFSIPLAIVSILSSLNINIPRYFLDSYVGTEDLGYFSAIAYILVAGNLIIRPLSLVAAPRLASNFQNGNMKKFVEILTILLISALFIGILILLIIYNYGEFILTLVYNHDYAQHKEVLFIIMIGSVISYLTAFVNIAIIATRKFKVQPIINIITLVIAFTTSIIIIPKYGINGAAFVTLIVYFTNFIGNSLLLGWILFGISFRKGN